MRGPEHARTTWLHFPCWPGGLREGRPLFDQGATHLQELAAEAQGYTLGRIVKVSVLREVFHVGGFKGSGCMTLANIEALACSCKHVLLDVDTCGHSSGFVPCIGDVQLQ